VSVNVTFAITVLKSPIIATFVIISSISLVNCLYAYTCASYGRLLSPNNFIQNLIALISLFQISNFAYRWLLGGNMPFWAI